MIDLFIMSYMVDTQFAVGQRVHVLAATWLAKGIERIAYTTRVKRITFVKKTGACLTAGEPLYWLEDRPIAQTARTLRAA